MPASPLPPPPPAVPVGPRYRYTQIPPTAVTLRAGDLIPFVPQDSWVLGSNAEQLLEFSTSEILKGPVPKIAFSTLVELAPGCFRPAKEGEHPAVRLPISRLVAAYHLVSHREQLEEPWVDPLPLPGTESTAEGVGESAAPQLIVLPATSGEEFAPPAVSEEPPPVAKVDPPAAVEPPPLIVRPSNSTPSSEFAPPIPPPPAADPVEKPLPASSRGIFSVLPMFRRKEQSEAPGAVTPPETPQSPAAETPVPARRPRVELPPPKSFAGSSFDELNPSSLPRFTPKPPIGAITTASWSAQPPTAPPEPVAEPVAELPPAPPAVELIPQPPIEPAVAMPPAKTEIPLVEPPSPPVTPATPLTPPPPKIVSAPAVLVETQHLSVAEAKQSVLANQEDLQAVFLTDENLTPERIVELCGGFPGINSCVLSRGGGVVASHNVPDTIDLVSLSAHALEMIRAMRESSAKMGVGAVPAVTIHSEKGPITFFHEDDICFLVLHKDRGFVPGVREKLQHVVHHLAQARLPRPILQPSRVLEG